MRGFAKDTFSLLLGVAVVATLLIHIWVATMGLSHSVGGPHDFRQSQTAIAAYYIQQDGFAWDYKIPVLGPDWRLPHEMPFYQWVVARLSSFTGLSLEVAARLVSLLCFYLSLPVLVRLLRLWQLKWSSVAMVLLLTLSTSTYIFYSRAVLIESMALLLMLFWLERCSSLLIQPRALRWRDGWLLLPTIAAAGIKVTTFSVGMGLLILLIGYVLMQPQDYVRNKLLWQRIGFLGGIIVSAGLTAFLWNQFILHSWSQTPQYADAHEGIQRWNFGELSQRNRAEFWGRMYVHVLANPFGSGLLGLFGLAAFALSRHRERLLAFAFLSAWFSGFLVWANLYYVHDYYVYASAVFFVVWAVLSCQGLVIRYPLFKWPVGALILAFTIGQFHHYFANIYYQSQRNDWGAGKREFAEWMGRQIPEDGVLMILGDDWSPFLPYYAQRYANMVRWPYFWRNERYLESVDLMREEGRWFAAVIVRNQPEFLEELQSLRAFFGFELSDPVHAQATDFVFYRIEATDEGAYPRNR